MCTTSPSRALTLPAVPTTRPRRSISRATAMTSPLRDTRDCLSIWWFEHARLGEDRGHELGGRDVECGIERGAVDGELRGVALLDRDVGTGGRARVDRGHGRGHVERYAVPLGQHRERIGADLV